jgi:hypothetical protein
MNERIKELLLKAGFTNAYFDPKDGFELVFVDEDHTLESVTKFAEMIVKECANQCDPESGLKYSPNAKSSLEDCKNKILKHFGVKK